MVEVTRYQQLNPLASAVAAGCTAFIFALIVGAPMMGSGMMGGYGGMTAHGYGLAIVSWFGGLLVAALGGAVFAWIYNAVNR